MMKEKCRNVCIAVLAAVSTAPALAAENLLTNPSFESGDVIFAVGTFTWIPGWFILDDNDQLVRNDPLAVYSQPAAGAQEGALALNLFNDNPGFGFVQAQSFSGDFGNQNFSVQPGDEVYATAQLLTEQPLVDGAAFRGMKIAFFDEFGKDIAPSAVYKGLLQADCRFPGIDGDPILGADTEVGVWQQAKVQGVAATDQNRLVPSCNEINGQIEIVENAPPGAVSMRLFLFNINFTGSAAPIFFDNAFLGILQPDDDSDRIENSVDGDPISISTDFSDGVTSGTVLSDNDGILAIDDATDPAAGVSIVSDPGNLDAARVRVCGNQASIRILPSSVLDVTCGSVILDVAPGSEPVTLEIELNGESATVEVPPENTVTFEPETASLQVASESDEPEPVVLTVGGTAIAIEAGETLAIAPFADFFAGIKFDDAETKIEATFSLGDTSNGIYPPSEAVSVSIGSSIITIPPGLFGDDGNGEFKFEGDVNSAETKIEIKSLGEGAYSIEVNVESQLDYLVSPIDVGLTIGDDRGVVAAEQDD